MRWTIRKVDPDVIEMVREVADMNDLTLGECVNDAVRDWYDSLPEEDEIDLCEIGGIGVCGFKSTEREKRQTMEIVGE